MQPLVSHPNHPDGTPHLTLRAHCATVRNRIERLYRAGTDAAHDVAGIVGYLHDFGKATPQFQSHITPGQSHDGPEEERYHSRLGAFVTLYAARATGATDRDALAGAVAVARHHQRLPDAAPYTATTLTDQLDDPSSAVRTQIEAIDESWPNVAEEFIETATNGAGSWAAFVEAVESGTLVDQLRAVSAERELTGWAPAVDQLPPRLYDRVLHYWGSLTLADKSHAANLDEDVLFGFETLENEPLADHIASLQATDQSGETARLNEWRQTARKQALAGVHEWTATADAPRVATLTLPTGLGKTFTGLSCAFTLRDRLSVSDPPPVVVYALPYTSIIEQTRDHFESPAIWDADPTASAFTVHHYLSDTTVETGRDEATADASFLGESWRSGVVLTTFVQLFESLTGPTNGASTKLPALDGAVIVLDEPQALPKDWWDGIRRELETLTDEFGAHVISMTATQPALFDPVSTVSLLEAGAEHESDRCERCAESPPPHDVRAYFDAVNRVSYQFDESAFAESLETDATAITHDAAATRIRECARPATSVLAVCNTIASTRALTERVQDRQAQHIGRVYERLLRDGAVDPADPDSAATQTLRACGFVQRDDEWTFDDDTPPLFIGTFNSRYRPVDRRVLVRIASTLTTASVPFVLVSTQAIEAGVDISFQRVFRDIAPLDSIVQAAGRCNRSFEWGPDAGRVTVWTLADPDDPDDTCPASHVYERGVPGHLRLIADALTELGTEDPIADHQFAYDGVTTYFNRLAANKSVASPGIRTEINRCQASQLGRRSLINDYETVDILVGVTDTECERINAIGDAINTGEVATAYERLEACSDLRVSVPTRKADEALRGLPRVDRETRGTEGGIRTLAYTGENIGAYDLAGGGFLAEATSSVDNRFTI